MTPMQHPMLCMYRRGRIVTRGGKERVSTKGSWYPPDYPERELNPWRSLRRFWSWSFALENYPTLCMYRRSVSRLVGV